MFVGMLLSGVINFILCVFVCLTILYLSFKFFGILTRNIDLYYQIRRDNLAVAIVAVSFVISISIVLTQAINPFIYMINSIFFENGISGGAIVVNAIKLLVIFIAIMFFAFIIIWFSLKVFSLITPGVDEMKELKDNNVSIAVYIATLVISVSYIITDPVGDILKSFLNVTRIESSGIIISGIDLNRFVHGSIQLLIALLGSIVVISVSFFILRLMTNNYRDLSELKFNNIALSILASSYVAGLMILTRSTLYPVNKKIVMIFDNPFFKSSDILSGFGFLILNFLISSSIAFLLIWGIVRLFIVLTHRIDGLKGIKNKNISIAMILAVLIIVASFIMREPVAIIVNGILRR